MGPASVAKWRGSDQLVRNCGDKVLVRVVPPANLEKQIRPSDRSRVPDKDSPSRDICAEAEYWMTVIQSRALSGDKQAAEELEFLASWAIGTLEDIAEDNPSLLRPYARQQIGWPVSKTMRDRLTETEKELFQRIELGADALIEMDAATAKWKGDPPAGLAIILLYYLERARSSKGLDFGAICKKMKKMPRFTDESKLAWWEVAWSVLLETYPNPHEIPELVKLIRHPVKPRPTPGRIKEELRKVLKARFISLAPNKYFPTSVI
jgi:hypothetical protein